MKSKSWSTFSLTYDLKFSKIINGTNIWNTKIISLILFFRTRTHCLSDLAPIHSAVTGSSKC